MSGGDGQVHLHRDGPVATLVFDPGTVLAGQKDSTRKLGRRRSLRASVVEVARGERRFRSLDRIRRRVNVDPGSFGKCELVAAEGARQRAGAVDAALVEQRAQLRHQHPERLLPGRGEVLAPEQLGQLVTGNRPSLLRRQVREQDSTLAPGEALLVQPRAVRLDREALRHRDSDVQGPPSAR